MDNAIKLLGSLNIFKQKKLLNGKMKSFFGVYFVLIFFNKEKTLLFISKNYSI